MLCSMPDHLEDSLQISVTLDLHDNFPLLRNLGFGGE